MLVSQPQMRFVGALFVLLLTIFQSIHAVKHENFKTCSQSGFCSRNRNYADTAEAAGSSWTSPYALDPTSISLKGGVLTGTILKTVDVSGKSGKKAAPGETVRLPLTLTFLESGAARLVIDEEQRQKGHIELRHNSKIQKGRYNGAEEWVIAGGLTPASGAAIEKDTDKDSTKVLFGDNSKHKAIIRHSPFSIDFQRDGETQVSFNDRGLLQVEHWRPKVEAPAAPEKPNDEAAESSPTPETSAETTGSGFNEDTWWEESFGGNTDTKPRGPESIALDVTFPGYEHVYGIPEHTGPLSLRETRGGGDDKFSEPYRLYNSDVFEYELNSPMTLYGAIPFMQAHRKGSTVGVFWLNAAETWVDIVKTKHIANPLSLGTFSKYDTKTHWISESGVLDIFVLLGPTPQDMTKTYGELTGYTQLPQLFAIAYHQCRWNYVTDEDVKDVDRKFDRYDIPYDIIWLDLEYLDDRQYFKWDPLTFPDPFGMQKHLDEHERKLVVLLDPHIKKKDDYYVFKEMVSNDLAVKNKDMDNYEGWCWPGAAYWIDCFNKKAHTWWTTMLSYSRFEGSLPNSYLWNDMSEPSVFNGPETTMPKDNIHFGGWEHRDVHNINGLTFQNVSYHAMEVRDDPKGKTPTSRPFILTRSFYSGSQRLGAMWTGDNQAEWSYLAESIPMVLSQGISGFPFAGADVGGFFGNPSKELLTRWYQTGAFYPFFRGHAHIDTRRREPYLLGEPYTQIITEALRFRYQLLPAWYTAFHRASVNGTPIVEPLWYAHPSDEKTFGIDDQMILSGTGIITKPVTSEGTTSVSIYLPAEDKPSTYYDYFDYTMYQGSPSGKSVTIAAPLEKMTVLLKSGHIIPRRDRPRRSAGLMRWDPFTLVVVIDQSDSGAAGELYLDDGSSYAYKSGALIHRRFVYTAGSIPVLKSEDLSIEQGTTGKKTAAYLKEMDTVTVERVIIVGAPASWSIKDKVKISEEAPGSKSKDGTKEVDLEFTPAKGGKAAFAVVKNPQVKIGRGWSIEF